MQSVNMGLSGVFTLECLDDSGNLKWSENFDNIVVNAGLDHTLDSTIGAATQVTSWYVGVTDGTPTTAATDTMASHAGWVEIVAYSEAVRQNLTVVASSGQSVTNSASKASYTINGTATVGGAFIVSDSAKSGTAGTLFSVGAFTGGDRAVVASDVLNVTYTLSASDV